MFDDWKDVRGHVDYHVVGVGVWHETGEGAAAVHSEAAAVVDDDEGDAASFGGFGREADACVIGLVWRLDGKCSFYYSFWN